MPADDGSTRLAVYGTLAPGRKYHWVLAGLKGTWSPGRVHGHLHPEGWGQTEGYPALVYDESAPEIAVEVLQSDDLPFHWARIDEFEGPQYRRTLVPVSFESGQRLPCNIYELNRKS
jgi:gamma-glutamylcyclotransferase (GGCT)/AIG2-like uncharacterized protein YtfP